MWICGKCGEDSEDGFSACWRCGTDRNWSPGSENPAAGGSGSFSPSDGSGVRTVAGRGLFRRVKFAGFRAPAVEPSYRHTWEHLDQPMELRLFDTYLTWHRVVEREWFCVIPYRSVRHLEWNDTGRPSMHIVSENNTWVVEGSESELAELIQRLSPLIG